MNDDKADRKKVADKQRVADNKETDLPLVSSRSPSLARAQNEQANPSPTTDPQIIATLCKLVELEFELADCYDRIDEGSEQAVRRRTNADQVAKAVTALGGIAPRRDDNRRDLLPVAPSDFEYLQGRAAIDDAFEQNKRTLAASYKLVAEMNLPSEISESIARRITQ